MKKGGALRPRPFEGRRTLGDDQRWRLSARLASPISEWRDASRWTSRSRALARSRASIGFMTPMLWPSTSSSTADRCGRRARRPSTWRAVALDVVLDGRPLVGRRARRPSTWRSCGPRRRPRRPTACRARRARRPSTWRSCGPRRRPRRPTRLWPSGSTAFDLAKLWPSTSSSTAIFFSRPSSSIALRLLNVAIGVPFWPGSSSLPAACAAQDAPRRERGKGSL